ncbi:barstar family protein [Nocardioides yefusunii]|uniref:Barstar family protein n=1 Tax=Nocardioides yefusunii TaxID=2500546 RepID=A0ABW1QUX1_9ACTN|nr:barstar family protein [Nocardioides yefusunii]
MSGLAPLLAGRERPDVWTWGSNMRVDVVREVVEAAGWDLVVLDGAFFGDRTGFLAAAGEAFAFPEHYGANFDAFADLLDDIARPTLLLFDAWGAYAREDEKWFGVTLRILRERARRDDLPVFAALLRGPGPDVPGLAAID